jgi:hypothetical protein
VLGTTAKMPWQNVCFAQALAVLIYSVPMSVAIPNERMTLNLSPYQFSLVVTAGIDRNFENELIVLVD